MPQPGDTNAMDLPGTPPGNWQVFLWRQDGWRGLTSADRAVFFKSYIMPHFRCYLLNSADKIVSVDGIEAESDALAMQIAAQLIMVKYAALAAIEVWHRARYVGKVLSARPHADVESLLDLPSGLNRNRS